MNDLFADGDFFNTVDSLDTSGIDFSSNTDQTPSFSSLPPSTPFVPTAMATTPFPQQQQQQQQQQQTLLFTPFAPQLPPMTMTPSMASSTPSSSSTFSYFNASQPNYIFKQSRPSESDIISAGAEAAAMAQPDLKKVKIEDGFTVSPKTGNADAIVVKKNNEDEDNDDDYDIKETTGDGDMAEESEEVQKTINHFLFEGAGDIKPEYQVIINSAKEAENNPTLSLSPAPAAAPPQQQQPPPFKSVSPADVTSSSTSLQQKQQKIDIEYNLTITNVVSKVGLLNNEVAEQAILKRERENAENEQLANGAGGGPGMAGKSGGKRKGKGKGSAKRPTPFNLTEIAGKMRNATYTNRFSAARVKMSKPKATGLVFGCGTVVCTGTKTTEDNMLASKWLAKNIRRVTGMDISFKNYTVVNMTATVDVHFAINLNHLSKNLPGATVTFLYFFLLYYYYFFKNFIFASFLKFSFLLNF